MSQLIQCLRELWAELKKECTRPLSKKEIIKSLFITFVFMCIFESDFREFVAPVVDPVVKFLHPIVMTFFLITVVLYVIVLILRIFGF